MGYCYLIIFIQIFSLVSIEVDYFSDSTGLWSPQAEVTLTAVVFSPHASMTTSSEREEALICCGCLCYSESPPELEESEGRRCLAWPFWSCRFPAASLLGVCSLPLTSSDLECLSWVAMVWNSASWPKLFISPMVNGKMASSF